MNGKEPIFLVLISSSAAMLPLRRNILNNGCFINGKYLTFF